MKRGFIRTAAGGPSIKQQKAALAASGLDVDDPYGPVYIDERDAAIASLASGDVLVIAEPSCLGTTAADVLEALSQIGARSARVLDLPNDRMVDWHPAAQVPLEFAVQAGHASRVAQARKMRKARAASGNLGQTAFEWTSAKIKELRRVEQDGATREEQAKALGRSRATLQRKIREMSFKKGD